MYFKDLRIFKGCRHEDMIVIDNIVCSYALQLGNGIPIKPFNCGEDYELKYIADQLEGLRKYMKCGEFVERKFRLRNFYLDMFEDIRKYLA